MEGDASPPLGARRRFSALMDTHRFASPADSEPDFLSRQVPIKVRGTSLDGTSIPSPNLLEQRSSLKDVNGAGAGAGGFVEARGLELSEGEAVKRNQTYKQAGKKNLGREPD